MSGAEGGILALRGLAVFWQLTVNKPTDINVSEVMKTLKKSGVDKEQGLERRM